MQLADEPTEKDQSKFSGIGPLSVGGWCNSFGKEGRTDRSGSNASEDIQAVTTQEI